MGTKKQTIITLNGKQYDALTGEPITSSDQEHAVRPISDVVGAPAEIPTSVASPTSKPTAAPRPAGPKVMDVSRRTGSAQHRQTQRASTLMRSAVSKPKPGLKGQTKVIAPTQAVATSLATVQPKWPVAQVNPTRLNRAEKISQSQAISKFAPSSAIRAHAASPQLSQDSTQAAVEAIEHQPQRSKDLFERAIASADSHTEPPVNHKKLAKEAKKQARLASKSKRERPVHHHLASVVAASVAVLAIGGFIGLQNKSAITLRFADAKAGFQASLPSYQPDGYHVGTFTYTAGSVGTSFHSNTSNRTYTLNQQTTKWDSQALLDNYVRANYGSYQVLQSGQQIVYTYGKNNASWVKNGVWYLLTTDGSLSTSQVLNIASSI